MPLRASESPPTLSQTCHTLHALKPSCTCIISGKTPLHILRVSCSPAHPSTPSPFWPRQSLTLSSGALRPVAKSLTECVSHACRQPVPSPERVHNHHLPMNFRGRKCPETQDVGAGQDVTAALPALCGDVLCAALDTSVVSGANSVSIHPGKLSDLPWEAWG